MKYQVPRDFRCPGCGGQLAPHVLHGEQAQQFAGLGIAIDYFACAGCGGRYRLDKEMGGELIAA